MSQLAFDKEGQPFPFLPQAESLWVRRFRNPGARGTCEVLYDEDDELLRVSAGATIGELRRAVGHVPGLYRLDQCDDSGEVIDKATPAYVTIDPPRNALLSGGAADPLAIARDIAAINGDVSKTIADRAAGMMEVMAGCMRDMRGTAGGSADPRLLALLAKVAREKDAEDSADDGNEDTEHDEDSDEDAEPVMPPDPFAALGPLGPMVAAMVPKLGEAIAAKVIELVMQFAQVPPAAATASATATSAPASAPAPGDAPSDGAAAGTSPAGAPRPTAAPAPSEPIQAAPTPGGPLAPSTAPAETATARSSSAPALEPAIGVRNGVPTPAQLAHLLAIRAALTPREVAIVDRVIGRLDGATGAQWIADLSAVTVEQGVARLRALIPKAGVARAETAHTLVAMPGSKRNPRRE